MPSGRQLDVWGFYDRMCGIYHAKGLSGQPAQLPLLTQAEVDGILADIGIRSDSDRLHVRTDLIDTGRLEKTVGGFRPTAKGVREWHAWNRRI
ncbi:hypothetical protein HYX08_04750 [Candidatus Woesearchaeota archaeon]|nr:hypothetical protein [Candidatus Woesearchaeota archaeon]